MVFGVSPQHSREVFEAMHVSPEALETLLKEGGIDPNFHFIHQAPALETDNRFVMYDGNDIRDAVKVHASSFHLRETPLSLAAALGDSKLVKILLAHGADPDPSPQI